MNIIDVNMINDEGLTALMLAVQNKKAEAVKALLFSFREDEQKMDEESFKQLKKRMMVIIQLAKNKQKVAGMV